MEYRYNKTVIIFGILILLAILYCVCVEYDSGSEKFDGDIRGQISLRPVINVGKNIKLNKYGRVMHVGIQKPKPSLGETSCKKVKCPSSVGSDAICWRCE